jgi:hypothetical protein
MQELHLEKTFREKIFEPLLRFRGHDGNEPGMQTSLNQFMGETLHLTNGHGTPLTKRDLYDEMGVQPWTLTWNALIQRPDDFRFLAGEEINDMIIEGIQSQGITPWYRELCFATDVPVGSIQVISPKLEFHDASPAPVGQGETLPLARISMSDRGIRLAKKGRMIEITDEAAKSAPLNLLQPYVVEAILGVEAQDNDGVIDTMVNGDQRDGSDACQVVGIASPSTLAYDDFDYVWIFGADINQRWFKMVTNRKTAAIVRKIDEFRDKTFGTPRVQLEPVNDVEPSRMRHIVSRRMADGQILLVNEARATRHITWMPFQTENARYPERMVSGVAVAKISGFENVQKKSRVIIDTSKDIDAYDFPADWEQAA